MFCQKCGSKLDDGVVFCPDCGAPVEEAEPQVTTVPADFQSEPAPEPAEPAPVYTAPQEPEAPVYTAPAPEPQPYVAPASAPVYTAPQPAPQPAPNPYQVTINNVSQTASRPNYLGPWAYWGLKILFNIPIVGFIFLIVFSCNRSNINRRNFARSYWCDLIIAVAIILVAVLICCLIAAASGAPIGKVFEDLGDLIKEAMPR